MDVSRGNVWIRISYKRLLGIKTLSISQEDFFASVAWRQPNDGGWGGLVDDFRTLDWPTVYRELCVFPSTFTS